MTSFVSVVRLVFDGLRSFIELASSKPGTFGPSWTGSTVGGAAGAADSNVGVGVGRLFTVTGMRLIGSICGVSDGTGDGDIVGVRLGTFDGPLDDNGPEDGTFV